MPIQAHAAGSRASVRRAIPVRAVLLLATAWLSSPAPAAPRTDVIVLVNGDRLTGEIKSLEHNRLKLGTDHMGTVYIEWDKIARVQSDQYLLLEREDGSRYFGQLQPGTEDGRLQVDRGDERATPGNLAMASVVRAVPIEGGEFVDRLDGYVSAGLDIAKANDRRSMDFAGGLSSRTREREWAVDGSVNLTDDGTGATSERHDVGLQYRQFRERRDFYLGFAELSRNTELDLNLRSLFGGGYGGYFVQTNTAEWAGGLGLAYSNEHYAGGQQFNSLEAVFYTTFSIFRYDFPETDIGGTMSLLPSLTKSDRYRAEGDLHAKYEFVDDLYFELRLWGSFDSEPPTAGATKSDYGLVTSLGYSF